MPTGIEFREAVLVLAGNIFIIIFVVRSIGAYGRKDWGELVMNFLAAILIAGLIYANAAVIEMLKTVWGLITGGD